MPSEISEIIVVSIAGTAVVLLLLVFLLAFFFAYQRRQILNKQEKATLHAQYSQEILQAQIEVQNQTLQQIGQELHDNIGQLLSVAKINLNILEESQDLHRDRRYILQANEIITEAIGDVRALTKSFDSDIVKDFGLRDGVCQELIRINKTNRFKTNLSVIGEEYALGYDREIVLFRIFQELLGNAIKHSNASRVQVSLEYAGDEFRCLFEDDGIGFQTDAVFLRSLSGAGSGLRNIKRRAELIKGTLVVDSSEGRGTKVKIHIHR